MKMNSNTYNLLILAIKAEQVRAQIGEDKIWEKKTVKLSGISIENNLKFDEY